MCVKLSPPRKMLTGKSYKAVPRLYQSTPYYVCSGLITFQKKVSYPNTKTYYYVKYFQKACDPMWEPMTYEASHRKCEDKLRQPNETMRGLIAVCGE